MFLFKPFLLTNILTNMYNLTHMHNYVFQVILLALLLTFLFKKDTDMSDYEQGLGKMEERDENIQAANKGFSSKCIRRCTEQINQPCINQMYISYKKLY